jgi:phosphatidylglycerophosphatase C
MTQENVTAAELRSELPIVAFDFDGTMTVRDSFSAFLKWRAGPVRWWWGCVRLIPAGLNYLLGHRDRGRIKIDAVGEFLRGVPLERLEADAERFAQLWSRRLLRPDAVAAFERWRAMDVRLLIVTASPTVVVAPFARGLGADDVVGTLLTYDAEGRVTGAFEGANCRGPEKVARLQALYGPDVRLKAAYGDTSGDTEMLAIADEPYYRVFTGRP